eukprot:Em0019g1213a
MASAIHGLALPEISVDNFEQSWTRFEFVAVANKWDNGRELAIIPALLRGKLQDFYITLGDSEKKDLPTLKKSLRDRAGLTKDPLTSAKKFTEKKQDSKESVRDFEVELRKLFAEAYPDDDADRSSVLLGRFVTGLLPDITKQILLRGVPTKMEDAVRSAIEIERALGFQTAPETQPVQALRVEETTGFRRQRNADLELQEKLDQVLQRMEALERRFDVEEKTKSGRRGTPTICCYNCNKEGHIRRNCPLLGREREQVRGRREGTDREWNKAPAQSNERPSVDLTGTDLTQSQKQKLENLIWEFRSLFVTEGGPTGRTSKVKHAIITNGLPVREPIRRIPHALQETVKVEVKKMLKDGVNSMTQKDAYPLPRIDETLEALTGSQFFTTLDLASGYWQVEMEEADRKKTAFSTREGHFEFNVMPFGLTNAPATFQRLMECVLAGLTYEQCLIYLDDIVVFSVTFDQHLERLKMVFHHLAEAGLKLKPSKCHFAKSEIRYLGHIVSRQGIQADPDKTSAMISFPVPSDIKELRQFLGLTNYYRRFIKGYSSIAEPLHTLTRKTEGGFKWNSECQNAFQHLKHLLVSPPILAYPQFQLPFVVASDASGCAIGAVLSQEHEGEEKVIAYWSRQLSKAERNYSTIEREALAVVAAVKEFFPYLYGKPFNLLTDHNPLTSLRGLKDTGGRITRWLLFLQQFDIAIKYRAGKSNGNADEMSRRRPDEEKLPVVNDGVFVNGITCLGDQVRLKREQAADEFTSKIVRAIENGMSPLDEKWSKFFLEDGVLCRHAKSVKNPKTQTVIPKSLRALVFELLHSKSGHLGVHKTLEKVKERFFWPGYEQDIREAVKKCEACQHRNTPVPVPQAPLGTIKSEYPFQRLSWDIMGPLPATSCGNKYILVVTDLFSKWVETFPLAVTDSITLARILTDEVICRYGVPESLHSDQGANFVSEVMQSLCAQLGIKCTQTSAYHPEGNGQVERFNRTLEAMLSKVVEEHQKDWDCHLQKVLFAFRTAVHESTGYTPLFVMSGRSPNLPIDVLLGRAQTQGQELPDYVRKTQSSLKSAFSVVRQRLHKAHQRQKQLKDQAIAGDAFQVGGRVWLFVPAIKKGQTRKFSSLWRGPYTIIDKVGPVNYHVQLIGGTQKRVVHRNRLKPCLSDPEPESDVEIKNPEPSSSKQVTPEENNTHMEVVQDMTLPEVLEDETVIPVEDTILENEDHVVNVENHQLDARRFPLRNRQPPQRYGDYVLIDSLSCEDARNWRRELCNSGHQPVQV